MIEAIPHTLSTQGWWIVSRSSAMVAFVLVTASVFLGLTMAGKPLREPQFTKTMRALHEQTALAALVAIGIHVLAVLADPWLKPGVAGVAVPFVLGLNRFWNGIGVIAAYLAFLLGLSFYLRRHIGAKRWRLAHRATIVVYVLGLFHALGAGSDTGSPVFLVFAAATAVPIAILFVYRLGAGRRAGERRDRAVRERRRATAHASLAESVYDTA
ncbi:MAG TPA: ferric reductase-like transmembrane domain-containing protein [Solirubrobacterales bacterium]|nr:ferric reductase-like transmembrane domain-containing protein [Solirubrobacterales bacterium]